MFVISEDETKGLTSTPTIWLKKCATGDGYFWPRYGLHFKLQNYVPLPLDPVLLKNEWRYVPCCILLNGKTFKTLKSAEKAVQKLLNESHQKKNDKKQLKKNGNTEEVEGNEAKENDLEANEVEENEVEANEVEANEIETNEVEANEVEANEVVADEGEDENIAAVQKPDENEAASEETNSKDVEDNTEANKVVVDEGEKENLAAVTGPDKNEAKRDETESKDVESLTYLPIPNPKSFKDNELLLKNKAGFIQLEAFYLRINEKDERKFFDRCVEETFDDNFLLNEIAFKKDGKRKKETEWIGEFNTTQLYTCMKSAVVEKLGKKDLDDTQLKKMFIANFDRIKRAIRARP